MSCPCFEQLISAGYIAPRGREIYQVAFAPEHKTLKVGDSVIMTETPDMDNLFVRLPDYTLHDIRINDGYVLVVKIK